MLFKFFISITFKKYHKLICFIIVKWELKVITLCIKLSILYTFYSRNLEMDANNAANEIKEAPERFFKLLEAGTLAYSEIIEYAFVIFGITKHGKTTLSHYLVNNSLKAYLNRN